MTLIITSLVNDTILSISDRRFTIYNGRSTSYDDKRNKIIQYCNNFLVSFTGIANFGAESRINSLNFDEYGTDIWLLRYLARFSTMNDALMELPKDLKSRMRRPMFAGHRLAVKIAGWTKIEDHGDTHLPYVHILSNFDLTNFDLFSNDGSTFSRYIKILGESDSLISVGSLIPTTKWKSLQKEIQRDQHLGRPTAIHINTIVRLMRNISLTNRLVGRNYLINILPKTRSISTDAEFTFIGSMDPNAISCFYIPESEKIFYGVQEQNSQLQYGHHVVCNGAAYSDYEVGIDGKTQYVQCKIQVQP